MVYHTPFPVADALTKHETEHHNSQLRIWRLTYTIGKGLT